MGEDAVSCRVHATVNCRVRYTFPCIATRSVAAFLVHRRRAVWQPCDSWLRCHESAELDLWIPVNCPVRCAASAIASQTFSSHCHEERGSFSSKSSARGMAALRQLAALPESAELDW